ncbi:MAG: hypothetical protein Tsb0034_16110 [Ekhidna sp.]
MRYLTATMMALLLFGCTTSDKEDTSELLPSGFHFYPNQGTSNKPIGLLADSGSYHLFYTTGGDVVGYAKSPNFLHWNFDSSIEPGEALSNISWDSSEDRFVLIEGDAAPYTLKTSTDLNKWSKQQMQLPNDASGIPRISRFQSNWILTLTNGEEISFFSSSDLITWNANNKLTVEVEASAAQLASVEDQAVLLLSAKNASYFIGSYDEQGFVPASNLMLLDHGQSITDVIATSTNQGTYLIGNLGKNSFTAPRKLSLSKNESTYLKGFPGSLVSTEVTAKRRSRLSQLKGDKSSWFSFPIEGYDLSFGVVLTNADERIAMQYDKRSSSVVFETELSNEKRSWSSTINSPLPDTVQVDVLIDYRAIEIYLNDGFFQASFPISPKTIPDRMLLEVDNSEAETKGIVYSISDKPVQYR